MPTTRTGLRFIAHGKTMRALLHQARRYAAVDATILITGETGAGKDMLARYIHATGPRRREPFVTVDCPGLPATLVEAELFGHERGAFTDATTARPGRFEMAGHGTLYLDSVTRLNPSAQGTLLRVVEERRVTRLGATSATDVRARLIASADADVEQAVAGGILRAELFHRLSVLPMHVPPLRERLDDILPLARAFATAAAARVQRPAPTLARDAEEALLRYRWPGNVRELQHVIERILVAGVGDVITSESLPVEILEGHDAFLEASDTARPTLADVERRYIEITLRHARGNQTRAAEILGISRKALWEKRKRYGLR